MFFEKCDVMKSISTRDIKHFLIHLLNRKSFGHKNWSTNRYIVMGYTFKKYFV